MAPRPERWAFTDAFLAPIRLLGAFFRMLDRYPLLRKRVGRVGLERKGPKSSDAQQVAASPRATYAGPAKTADRSFFPTVGEYYADYSQPTPEEIDAVDPKVEDLFKRSKVISRKTGA